MSEEVSGVQLEVAAMHENSHVITDLPPVEDVELDNDTKPPAYRSSKELRTGMTKPCVTHAVGEANATNAFRNKEKQQGGSRGMSSAGSSRKDRNELVEKKDTNTAKDILNTIAPHLSSEFITECATTWSVVGFGITSLYTGIHIPFALNGDETIAEFYAYVLIPICTTVQIISFLLKPRREDFAYKAFLYLQYVLFTVVSEILTMVGNNWDQNQVIQGSVQSLIWLCLLPVFMHVRAGVAGFSDKDLSDFLSMSVIKGGLFVGLAQLTFLAFSSVQCQSEAR